MTPVEPIGAGLRAAVRRPGTHPSAPVVAWLVLGASLAAIQLAMLVLSGAFAYDRPLLDQPVVTFVTLHLAAGALYLALVWLVPRSPPTAGLLAWVLAAGLLMRALMLPSTPMLEDDFYRYLWDGGVTVEGLSPYRHAPADALGDAAAPARGEAPTRLGRLAIRSAPVAERVNHPELRTPYPPVAQAAFALAHLVEPWSLAAWRGLLLVLDATTVVLLYMLLVRMGRSPLWLALYWWSPLVVKELFNSAHVDALLPPLLAGTLLLAVSGRRIAACGCLALAAAVKLWPIALVPLVVRAATARGRELALAAAIGLLGMLGIACWAASQLAASGSGLGAYLGHWQMNDALFGLLAAATDGTLHALGEAWTDAGRVTRALVAAALVVLALWLARKPVASGHDLAMRCTTLAACMFFLLPAQFPWYYVSLMPFLVLVPNVALLLASALLSLYYLRFHFDARGEARFFDTWIVGLEFAPVLLLLSWEWLRRRRAGARGLAEARSA